MEIKKVVTGALEENCYIIILDGKALIVDPGDDYPLIKEALGTNKLVGILITHSHFDHIGALRNFTKRNMKIFKRSSLEEKKYTCGPFTFEAIYTPGHSKDSVSFYFKENKIIFCGDFVFKGSVGRVDLPTGSMLDLKNSIKKILEYDLDISLLPGHGENTSIKEENNNLKGLI